MVKYGRISLFLVSYSYMGQFFSQHWSRIITIFVTAGLLLSPVFVHAETVNLPTAPAGQLWHYQCIDTMKVSRDSAREFLSKPAYADTFIAKEVAMVKSLGANCIALGTPYDEEFVPLLAKWVQAARQHGLLVWFRGNFAGWEGWFGYAKLKNGAEHSAKLADFITKHADLFVEGDILSPAPEAENGILGNPWRSDAAKQQLKDFVWQSSDACQKAVMSIGKKIHCGYFSANGDVARDIYNQTVLQKAGAVTVIDHYVSTSQRMGRDLDAYVAKHNLPIMVGEFGAPIPDINGKMTEAQQAQFVDELFREFYTHKKTVIGVNYWVLRGGSTSILNDDGTERQVANVIRNYFMPGQLAGKVVDGIGRPVKNAAVSTGDGMTRTTTGTGGGFLITAPVGGVELTATAEGYTSANLRTESVQGGKTTVEIRVDPLKPSLWYKIRAKLHL